MLIIGCVCSPLWTKVPRAKQRCFLGPFTALGHILGFSSTGYLGKVVPRGQGYKAWRVS